MPILNVPMVSQWGMSANARTNDCGVACVTMLLQWYSKRGNLTVDQLTLETTLANSDTGLLPAQLVSLAARHGLPTVAKIATLNDIRTEINEGRPVIALIQYSYILGRLDTGFWGGHFVLVIGHDPDHFILNDPDDWTAGAKRGHEFFCPVNQLDLAMNAYGNQAVLVRPNLMGASDQIVAYATQAEDLLDQIKTLAGQVITPDPVSITVVVNGDKTRVRHAPSTSAAVDFVLNTGVQLQVVDPHITADGYDWWQIVSPMTGYIAKSVVSPKV